MDNTTTASLLQDESSPAKDIQANESTYHTLGQLFTQAREYHKLSIEDIAKKLCLTEAKIRAIEADDLQQFDAPIYARGYIESYAKLVGMPAELWEPMLSKLGLQLAPKPCARRDKAIPIKKSIASMSMITPHRAPKASQKSLYITAVVLIVVLIAVSWWSIRSHPAPHDFAATQPIPLQLKQGG